MSVEERFRKIDARLERLERGVCLLERTIAVHAKSAAGLFVTREDYGDVSEMGRALADIRSDLARSDLYKESRT